MQNFAATDELRALDHGQRLFALPAHSYVYPIPSSTYRALVLLPTLLDRLNAHALAREAQLHVLKDISISTPALLEALSAPSARLRYSYQRSEFVGDSVLKLLAMCSAFVALPEGDEGQLSAHMDKLVSNRVLAGHCLRLRLWRYVAVDAFTSRSWVPFRFAAVSDRDDDEDDLNGDEDEDGGAVDNEEIDQSDEHSAAPTKNGDERQDEPNDEEGQAEEDGQELDIHAQPEEVPAAPPSKDSVTWTAKRLADIVEAVLGAVPAAHIDNRLQVAITMGVLPGDVATFAGFGARYRANLDVAGRGPPRGTGNNQTPETVRRLMADLGYTFSDPELALHAVTHSSCLGSTVPSYERLETLGDAVLDYLVVEFLQEKYASYAEGDLHLAKSSCVNNQALAALCVSLRLHKHILHSSAALAGAIAAHVDEMDARKEECDAAVAATAVGSTRSEAGGSRAYWEGLAGPKALADVAESVLGAVLLDSAFDLDATRAVFARLYRPFFEAYCLPVPEAG